MVDLLQLKALLITLKEFGVTSYKDSNVQLEIAQCHRDIHSGSALGGPEATARPQGPAEGSAGSSRQPAEAAAEDIWTPAVREIPTELEKINPLYFDPALGLEVTRRG